MWSKDDLAKGHTHSSWVGKYNEVQAECKKHGVSQSGTLKNMLGRLREHCKEVHPVTTRQARLDTYSNFFKAKLLPVSLSSVNLCQKIIKSILSKIDHFFLNDQKTPDLDSS